MPETFAIQATDGQPLIYDRAGQGPPVLLLHGGGVHYSRQSWHDFGYIEQLKNDCTVLCSDIRGHGDSGRPTDPSAYTIDQMTSDILSVADHAGFDRFSLWGFSFGGNIGRYLASQSDRIEKFAMIGIPFGAAAGGGFRQFIFDFQARWRPLVEAGTAGTLDLATLGEKDRSQWQTYDIPVMLAWLTAMLDWPDNEPHHLRCPTLWLAGSENEVTIASMAAYSDQLEGTSVTAKIIKGLNHQQEFEQVDVVLPHLLGF